MRTFLFVTLVTLACVPTHQALWMLAFPRGWLEEMAFDVRADLPHVSVDDILKGLLAWYPRSLQIKTACAVIAWVVVYFVIQGEVK